MVDMIEENRLIHGYPAENWKDGIEERCRLKPITVVSHDGENEKEDNKNKDGNFLFHIHYLYGMSRKSVKKKSLQKDIRLLKQMIQCNQHNHQ